VYFFRPPIYTTTTIIKTLISNKLGRLKWNPIQNHKDHRYQDKINDNNSDNDNASNDDDSNDNDDDDNNSDNNDNYCI
jgi:hypothetical protein